MAKILPEKKEIRNASAVCPERVLPLASTMVPETMTGILYFFLRYYVYCE
jgi:hypothetical protein